MADRGGIELDEHRLIDSFESDHPRRERWLVTHDTTAFAYRNPQPDDQQIGNETVEHCLENTGDLRFVAMTEA